MRHLLLLVTLIFAAEFCHADFMRYSNEVLPPTPKTQFIPVIVPGQETRPYKIIGQVSTEVRRRSSSEKALKILSAEARKMGGQALLNIQEGKGSTTTSVPMGRMVVKTEKKLYSAEVAVFVRDVIGTDPTPTGAATVNH